MNGLHANCAEIEYAVMLTVLNFQTKFMESHYTGTHLQTYHDLIELTLTRTAPIPAEDRLAESSEGQALLQQVHHSLFHAGKHLLQEQLEQSLGVKIRYLLSHLDSATGTNVIIVKLAEPLYASSS